MSDTKNSAMAQGAKTALYYHLELVHGRKYLSRSIEL